MIKMDNDQHGIFNNGNSYIVLHRIRTGSFTQQVLYYWLVCLFFLSKVCKWKACGSPVVFSTWKEMVTLTLYFWLSFQGSKLENDNQDSVLDLVLSMNKTFNNQCIVVSSIYNDWFIKCMKSITCFKTLIHYYT